jgi:hypothetical protein
MIQKKKSDVDVVMDVLVETRKAYPESIFVNSLLFQYQERGGLSKKQLEGLRSKASKVATIAPGKLATLDAIILKKPTRYKSDKPVVIAVEAKDEHSEKMIHLILQAFPEHKRVLFLKVKNDSGELLSAADKVELERFYKFLQSKSGK